MTDSQLEQRANQIAEQVAIAELLRTKQGVTEKSLGFFKRRLTVGVLQGVRNGQVVTMVNGHNPKYEALIKQVLTPGEIYVDSVSVVPDNLRTGSPRKTGHIHVHSEQVLAGEADVQGITEAKVATSNAGCNALCVSNIKEQYPQVEHVNPSKHVHSHGPEKP